MKIFNLFSLSIAIFLCFVSSASAVEFDLRKVVPAAAFTAELPCNKCALPGQTTNPKPTLRPRPTVDPCDKCRVLARGQQVNVDLAEAKQLCANCAFRKLQQSEKMYKMGTSVKQSDTQYEVLFIAVNKHRKIYPTVKYEGSTGGEGCSPIEVAFGVPDCIVTHFKGTSFQLKLIVDSAIYGNWLAFQVKKGTKRITMTVPKDGECGRRQGDDKCKHKSKDFHLDGQSDTSKTPGCNNMDYQKKVKTFAFWCGWRQCDDSRFSARLYTDFTNFKYVTLTGSSVSTCPISEGQKLFII